MRSWYPAAFAADAKPLPDAATFQHLFAGMVMLADWLASDTRFFPLERDVPPGDEIHDARERAAKALLAVGLDSRPHHAALPTLPHFTKQFPFAPNALQQAVDDIPARQDGGLAIIEAETGCGKTEAALRYFYRLWTMGLVDGLYFANPLRFAATQLFDRVVECQSRTFGGAAPSVVLAVPGYMRVDDAHGRMLPGFSAVWDDDPEQAVAERRWACEHPKRFLAAPVAVGTIDQALLGAIRVRHAHLRAAAISRSLLVIDEVHASDEYMTRLTLNLVRLFRRVGGQVLLLSATLGGAARQRYLQVFTGGRKTPSFHDCVTTPYPCVTTLDGTWPVSDDRPRSQRKPPVRIIPEGIQDDARAVARLAADLAGPGGRILVLRNSVAAARETQAALEELLAPEALFSVHGVACPHHSRYAPGDRALLDAAVAVWFGSTSDRQDGVLVSTQTLEQSLDVDFDVLVTDLCPMDVLLQRIGRLFRHLRRNPLRPTAHAVPRCYVLTPRTFGPEALRQGRRHQYGLERAYENILAVMTTWERIGEMDAAGQPLVVPDMCRELVETALHPEMLEKAAARHGMMEEWKALRGRAGARAQAASMAGVDWDRPFAESAGMQDEAEPLTRLGVRDHMAEFPEPFEGPFGQAVDRLAIPGWLMPRMEIATEPVILEHVPGVARFRLGPATFRYDRYGLQKEKA